MNYITYEFEEKGRTRGHTTYVLSDSEFEVFIANMSLPVKAVDGDQCATIHIEKWH